MMTIDDKHTIEKMIEQKSAELERKIPKLTWLWRLISLLALAASACCLNSCTFSQTTTDGEVSKVTTVQINPSDDIIHYAIPVVRGK